MFKKNIFCVKYISQYIQVIGAGTWTVATSLVKLLFNLYATGSIDNYNLYIINTGFVI